MNFDLLAFLKTVLGGLNVNDIETRVLAWLKDAEAKYPDLRDRVDALVAWLTSTLAEVIPALVLTSMKDTIWGIASDIIHGTAGVDPKSWEGGV
jgi:hypothetical protein